MANVNKDSQLNPLNLGATLHQHKYALNGFFKLLPVNIQWTALRVLTESGRMDFEQAALRMKLKLPDILAFHQVHEDTRAVRPDGQPPRGVLEHNLEKKQIDAGRTLMHAINPDGIFEARLRALVREDVTNHPIESMDKLDWDLLHKAAKNGITKVTSLKSADIQAVLDALYEKDDAPANNYKHPENISESANWRKDTAPRPQDMAYMNGREGASPPPADSSDTLEVLRKRMEIVDLLIALGIGGCVCANGEIDGTVGTTDVLLKGLRAHMDEEEMIWYFTLSKPCMDVNKACSMLETTLRIQYDRNICAEGRVATLLKSAKQVWDDLRIVRKWRTNPPPGPIPILPTVEIQPMTEAQAVEFFREMQATVAGDFIAQNNGVTDGVMDTLTRRIADRPPTPPHERNHPPEEDPDEFLDFGSSPPPDPRQSAEPFDFPPMHVDPLGIRHRDVFVVTDDMFRVNADPGVLFSGNDPAMPRWEGAHTPEPLWTRPPQEESPGPIPTGPFSNILDPNCLKSPVQSPPVQDAVQPPPVQHAAQPSVSVEAQVDAASNHDGGAMPHNGQEDTDVVMLDDSDDDDQEPEQQKESTPSENHDVLGEDEDFGPVDCPVGDADDSDFVPASKRGPNKKKTTPKKKASPQDNKVTKRKGGRPRKQQPQLAPLANDGVPPPPPMFHHHQMAAPSAGVQPMNPFQMATSGRPMGVPFKNPNLALGLLPPSQAFSVQPSPVLPPMKPIPRLAPMNVLSASPQRPRQHHHQDFVGHTQFPSGIPLNGTTNKPIIPQINYPRPEAMQQDNNQQQKQYPALQPIPRLLRSPQDVALELNLQLPDPNQAAPDLKRPVDVNQPHRHKRGGRIPDADRFAWLRLRLLWEAQQPLSKRDFHNEGQRGESWSAKMIRDLPGDWELTALMDMFPDEHWGWYRRLPVVQDLAGVKKMSHFVKSRRHKYACDQIAERGMIDRQFNEQHQQQSLEFDEQQPSYQEPNNNVAQVFQENQQEFFHQEPNNLAEVFQEVQQDFFNQQPNNDLAQGFQENQQDFFNQQPNFQEPNFQEPNFQEPNNMAQGFQESQPEFFNQDPHNDLAQGFQENQQDFVNQSNMVDADGDLGMDEVNQDAEMTDIDPGLPADFSTSNNMDNVPEIEQDPEYEADLALLQPLIDDLAQDG